MKQLLLLLLLLIPLSYAYNDYEMNIEGSNLDCEIKTNGTTEEYEIEDKEKLRGTYVKKFNLNCNSTIDYLEIFIYNNSERIYYNKLQNLTRFNYDQVKSKQKLYNVSIYIRDSFPKSNKCYTVLDTTKKNYFFDSSTNLNDKFIGGVFNDKFSFTCTNPLDRFQVLIDNRDTGYEAYSHSYTNLSKLDLNVNDILLKTKPLPKKYVRTPYVKPELVTTEHFILLYILLLRAS